MIGHSSSTRRGFGLGFLALGLFGAARASGQEPTPLPAVYPAIPPKADAAEGLVPPGWAIERRLAVDLDGDSTADLVAVLREKDPRHLLKPYGPEGSTLDTNPRILIAAFVDRAGTHRLALANTTLIPRHETATIEDPFGQESQGLEAGRRGFSIWLHRFASAGGRDMGNTKLTFRFAGDVCELIGFERTSVDRFSGTMLTTSANYLTGRLRRVTGTIQDDATRTTWSRLPPGRHLRLDEIGDGLAFEPRIA